ncbi:MAG: hypothetical protein Q9186_006437 [Xanthomendoza sp. 1 TL-2023]
MDIHLGDLLYPLSPFPGEAVASIPAGAELLRCAKIEQWPRELQFSPDISRIAITPHSNIITTVSATEHTLASGPQRNVIAHMNETQMKADIVRLPRSNCMHCLSLSVK